MAMTTAIDDDRLSETFAALASATRRAILARLAERRRELDGADARHHGRLYAPAVSVQCGAVIERLLSK